MTHDEVQDWLDRYIAAWQTYDPAAIGDLFADDARYSYHPWDTEPVKGRDAIVAGWLDDRDSPGTWEAWYKPFAVEGDRASVIGESLYRKEDGTFRTLYYNTFHMRFDRAGRCVEFLEHFMELPERLRAGR